MGFTIVWVKLSSSCIIRSLGQKKTIGQAHYGHFLVLEQVS